MTEILQRKFVKPASISNPLKCIVCAEVFIRPTRLFCSHTFCRQCIDQWLKSRNACPICRTAIDKKNMGSDRVAQSIIDQLQVFCPVDDCPWKGPNAQIEHHYENQCTVRDKVKEKNTGKSHKKVKNFTIEMIKDQQVQEKINANQIKGSLQARLLVAHRRNNPIQMKQSVNQSTNNASKNNVPNQIKKTETFDFLEDLFS